MNTNRDPIDPKALGRAVTEWLAGPNDEADIALEAVLTAQGVLTPGEGTYFEHEAREHGLLHIFLEDGTILEVTTEGTVEGIA